MNLPHVALDHSTAQRQSIWRKKRDTFNKSFIASAECPTKPESSLMPFSLQVHVCASPKGQQRKDETLVYSNNKTVDFKDFIHVIPVFYIGLNI